MMTFDKQIESWVQQGKIKKEKVHQDQIKTLLEKSEKDIKISKLNIEIDLETAYNLAYNSMIKAGRALMLSKGYRSVGAEQHKTTVEFCGYFIDDKSRDLIKSFDRMRRNRNTLAYDPWYIVGIEKEDALHAIRTAENFLAEITKRL